MLESKYLIRDETGLRIRKSEYNWDHSLSLATKGRWDRLLAVLCLNGGDVHTESAVMDLHDEKQPEAF